MDAILDDRGRGGGLGEGKRELPVLFHLIDVSRPRAAANNEKNDAAASQVVTEPTFHGSDAVQSPPPVTETTAPPVLQHSLLGTIPASGPSRLGELAPVPVSLVEPPKSAIETYSGGFSASVAGASNARASEDTALDAVVTSSPVTSAILSAEAPTPSPGPPHAVTPRSQIEPRRKVKTPASEDWFAAHGKFIACAFVVALIGTIYFSRNSRQQAAPTTAVAHPHSAVPAANSGQQPAPASTEASTAEASKKAAGESAPKLVESTLVSTESKAELHPPTSSQGASGAPADNKPQGKDSLFVFPTPKQGDDRFASRPGAASAAGNLPASQPAMPGAQPEPKSGASSAERSGQPALPPAYPTTSSPAPAYPVTASAPAAYPSTLAPPVGATLPGRSAWQPPAYPAAVQPLPGPPNYRSQFPLPVGPAPPQPQGSSPPPSTAMPGQYQPMDTTARGQRYERTGSGNY